MQTKRKAGLLIVFLLITVAMAVAFFPSVNSNVAEGLSSITAIDPGNFYVGEQVYIKLVADSENVKWAVRIGSLSGTGLVHPHPGHAAGGLRLPHGVPPGP